MENYTEEEIIKAAEELGISFNEYIETYKLKKAENGSWFEEEEEEEPIVEETTVEETTTEEPTLLGKKEPTTPDVVVEKTKASNTVSPSEDGFSERIKEIEKQLKSLEGSNGKMDSLDSPRRIKKYKSLVSELNNLNSQANDGSGLIYTGSESFAEFNLSSLNLEKDKIKYRDGVRVSGSKFTDDGGAILRQGGDDGFQALELDEFVGTPAQTQEQIQEIQSAQVNSVMNAAFPIRKLFDKIGTTLAKDSEDLKKIKNEDLKAATSIYNSLVNGFNQLNGLDEQFAYLGTYIFQDQDFMMNTFGEELGARLAKKNRKAFNYINRRITEQNKLGLPTVNFGDLSKRNKFNIINGKKVYKFGDFAETIFGGVAATLDGLTSFGASALTYAATGGIGIGTQMIAKSIYDANNTKANFFGLTTSQLLSRNKGELKVPLALGFAGYLMEKAGLNGVSKYINTMKPGGMKGMFNLFNVGNREGGTEWFQAGIEEYNISLSSGLNSELALKSAWELMKSPAGLENYYKGFAGAQGIGFIGSRLKAKAITRPRNKQQKIAGLVNEISTLEEQKFLTTTTEKDIENLNIDQNKLKQRLASTINENNEVVAIMTDQQIEEINISADEISNLSVQANQINNSTTISAETKEIQLNLIKEEKKAATQKIYDIRNSAERLVKNIDKTKKIAESVKDLNVLDLENSKEIQELLKDPKYKNLDKKASEQQAFIIQDGSTGEQTIVINKEQAARDQAFSVSFHETGHFILFETLKNSPKTAINLERALTSELNKIDDGQLKDSDFKKRLQDYKNNENLTEAQKAEEALTLFSDALNTGDIKFEDSIATKIGDYVRGIMQKFGIKVKFNNGRDVYNFLKDFNVSMEKGELNLSQINLASKGATGKLVESSKTTQNDIVIKESKGKEIDALVPSEITKKQWDKGERDNIINKTVPKLQTLIESKIPNNPPPGFSKEDFVQGTVVELLPHMRNFNPEVNDSFSGWINSQLQNKINNVFNKGEASTKEEFDTPVEEARGVISETKEIEKPKETKSKLRSILGIDSNKGKEVARTILKGKLPATTDKKLKSSINKQAKDEYLDEVRKIITPQFLEEKGLDILNTLPVADLVKLERLSKDKIFTKKVSINSSPKAVDQAIKEGVLPKNTNRLSGPTIYKKIKIDEQKAIDFLKGKSRRTGFAGIIAENLTKDAIPGVLKEEETINKRINAEESQGRKIKENDAAEINNIIDRDINLKFSLASIKAENNFIEELKILSKNIPGLVINTKKAAGSDNTSIDIEATLNGNPFNIEFKMNQNAMMSGGSMTYSIAEGLSPNKGLEGFEEIKKAYKDKVKFLDTYLKAAGYKGIGRGFSFKLDKNKRDEIQYLVKDASDAKIPTTNDFITKIYNKKNVNYIYIGGKGLYYMGSNPLGLNINEFKPESTTLEVGVRFSGNTVRADGIKRAPASLRVIAKIKGLENEGLKIENKKDFKNILKLADSKLKQAESINIKLSTPKRVKKPVNTKNVIDNLVKINKEETDVLLNENKNKDLNVAFNDIIENKTGIRSEIEYKKVKAQVAGLEKGRFKFFVPPSAEDFVGLLYTTLGKGAKGDKQMKFYKDNLLDPFSEGLNNLNVSRLALMSDFNALKKELDIVPKDLKKKLPDSFFTREQAVRVYIWSEQEMDIPGLSKADLKKLNTYVAANEDLSVFAENLITINKNDGYIGPKDFWTSGTIDTDLLEGINTTKRAQFLEVWQQNVDVMFSETNLNKLEAAFGKKYRDALENILQRMKTGRNRTFGTDNLTGRLTDWLTNSVGAIMFFNTRSAILQTISSINFLNWTDNNPLKAAAALANIPQYSKDFIKLMNSPFLLARRDGLQINVNEADIADMAKTPGNMAKNFIAKALRLGFLPTQIADSFAIASGGATFYRNRIKALVKDGMTEQNAEKQAMLDFIETSETSQQSSRADKISQQQAGPLGRIILAFANTPMQYTREIKKAALDLKNGRGDARTNVSKIIYYGVAQNLIFNTLQQALFAVAFEDDEEELTEKQKKLKQQKYYNILNSMSDQFLRGSGVGGAIVSTLKNTIIKLIKENNKNSPKFNEILIKELAQLSPPIGSKIRKLDAAGKSFSWNKKEIKEKGVSIDNPAILASANLISAATNFPADRIIKKIDNLRNATDQDLQTWQRIASAGGWSKWQLGIDNKPKIKLTREQSLIKLNKKDQIDLLKKLKISDSIIKTLKYEKDRVRVLLKKEKQLETLNK